MWVPVIADPSSTCTEVSVLIQGMNFLAALMLLWLPREAEAFGALALLMRDRGLRDLYKTDMAMLQVVSPMLSDAFVPCPFIPPSSDRRAAAASCFPSVVISCSAGKNLEVQEDRHSASADPYRGM